MAVRRGQDWRRPIVPRRTHDLWGGYGGAADLNDMWEYSTATPAIYASFGSGCNGTNHQPPRLSTTGRPWLGDNFALTLDQLPASTGLALVYTSFSNSSWNSVPLPLPLASLGLPGCQLLVAPQVPAAVFPSGGAAAWTLPLPNLAGLLGVRFFNQALVFDTGANAAGATVSNGGDGTIGAR